MKKLFIVAALLLTAVTTLPAQNTTKIGSQHRVDYGLYAGYGGGVLAKYGLAFIDINSAKLNLRTRLSVGLVERWTNPNFGLDVQYLIPLDDNGAWYFYPTAGAYMEMFVTERAKHERNSNTNVGGQVGCGFEYQITNSFGIFVQGEYQVMLTDTDSRVRGHGGLIFHF